MSDVELFDLADELLSFSAALLGARAMDGGPAVPDRQYVANGAVAIDCEQLTVSVASLRQGVPGLTTEAAITRTSVLQAQFNVSIFRCVPVPADNGTPPPADDITDSARDSLSDWQTLLVGIFTGVNDHTLFDACSSAQLVESVAYGPEGGFAGCVIALSVQL